MEIENCESSKPVENADKTEDIENTKTQESSEVLNEFKPLNVDLSQAPKLVSTTDFGSVFTKGCKFSPDGLCVLVCLEDQKLRLYDLPQDLEKSNVENTVTVQEGENVYDFQWYPLMNSNDPDTCCFATTSRFQVLFHKQDRMFFKW